MRAFYDFARRADDIADDPALGAQAKLDRLARFEAGLDGAPDAEPCAIALVRTLAAAKRAGAARHARALLGAFRQDAAVRRYRTWDDLLAYCRLSADPVGRFILDIHDEPDETLASSDALCSALQVLNHLQDLREDHDRLDRVYLPLDWIEAEGGRPDDLSGRSLTPALRAAVDRALERTGALLGDADRLPDLLSNRRLAGEVRAILTLAWRLHDALRRGDPLARRIALRRGDFARAAAAGLFEILRPVRRPVRRRPGLAADSRA